MKGTESKRAAERGAEASGMHATVLVSISGPTPMVRSCAAPRLPEGELNLLSVPAYVLGALWAAALVVWRARSIGGTHAGQEMLRFLRPTVAAPAVSLAGAWPDVPGLHGAGQAALLVALVASIGLAVVARTTQGRAYLALLGLASTAAVSLAVAAASVLTSGVPLSTTAAGLLVQVALLAALATGAWRLQRQLVAAGADDDGVRAELTSAPVARGVDRVASGLFFIYLSSVIAPVWVGRKLAGGALAATAEVAPQSAAAKLFNGAAPWFYGYGAAIGAVLYAAVLLVPPFARRARLVVLGCVLGVLAVGPGLTTLGEQARVAAGAVAAEVRATPLSATQLGWICGSWSSPAVPGMLTVLSGDGCRTLVTYQGQLETSRVLLGHDYYNDAVVPSAGSNSLNGAEGFIAGTYGDEVVAVADSPSAPGGHVLIATGMTSAAELWRFTCPAGSDGYQVRFSGSADGDQPAANRETLELYGLLEYIAVGCGSGGDYIVRTDGTLVGA